MPRIRSIKPEFWTDEKTARLPADTALFFIGIWTHADDYGFFPSSSSALALLLPRWRPQVVQSMLSRLQKDGLIELSRGAGVGLVNGWHHQKIKDRRASKWMDKEIRWDPRQVDAPRSAKNRTRIGEERSGEERISSPGVQAPAVVQAQGEVLKAEAGKSGRAGKERAPTGPTWEAYSGAYHDRYHTDPVRNASVNGKLAQLVKRLGDEAPFVAAFYVTHNDSFYVRQMHPVGLLLRDAEKLRTEWKTGRQVTGIDARHAEARQNIVGGLGKMWLEAKEREEQEERERGSK